MNEIECILPNKVYKGNLQKVAQIAEIYSHFEKFSEILDEACVEYIRENIDNFFDICASDVPDGETSVLVHKLMVKESKMKSGNVIRVF